MLTGVKAFSGKSNFSIVFVFCEVRMKGGRREGAGRPGWHAKSEECVRLDVRRLVKQAVFEIPRRGTWQWWDSDRGIAVASVAFRSMATSLFLEYCLAGRQVFQELTVVNSKCHFGGHRFWFECPFCSSRVALLYLRIPGFGCRRCSQVAYSSQSEDHIDRLGRRQYRIESRLRPNLTRPKGMHKTTYDRLKRVSLALLLAREDAIAAESSRRGYNF